ncbi:MAG: alpha/beta hydrolase [Verrucomicrobia bacterium]|nr:alpha/beta hydrolase [Verrucomicrobiota bacterium]
MNCLARPLALPAAIWILLISSQVHAIEPWEQLPPAQGLPPSTMSGYAAVNGVRIYYAEFGRGEPLILLHGGLGNIEQFGNQIPALEAHYKVIALDSRGHGRSTRSTAPFSYHLMADDVLGVMNYLRIPKAAVIGWSDGGIIGLDLAIYHPDRLNKLVAIAANYSVSGLHNSKTRSETLTEYYRLVRSDYERLSSTPNDYDNFLVAMRMMWRSQPEYTLTQLTSIQVPTLIVDGEYDEVVQREHAAKLARLVPGAKLVIIPGSSHFVMFQRPSALNQTILSFLAGSS